MASTPTTHTLGTQSTAYLGTLGTPTTHTLGTISMASTPTTPTIATKAGQEQIAAYLESNPEFLENYVISNVDFQTVERWVIRKARDVQKGTGGKIYYENMPN